METRVNEIFSRPTNQLDLFAHWAPYSAIWPTCGWVTDPLHKMTPNQQITALGNGVLPTQAVTALRTLIGHQPVL